MNLSNIATWVAEKFSTIQDAVSMIAIAFGTYIAWVGLSTWREQLTAQAERDLARRVLIGVYKVRNAIDNARLFATPEDKDNLAATKILHDASILELEKAWAELDVELLEGEAAWGDTLEYKSCFSRLNGIEIGIRMAYRTYYTRGIDPERRERDYLILFVDYADNEDELSNNLNKIVERIEDFLRPKLRLTQGKARKKKTEKESWRFWRR